MYIEDIANDELLKEVFRRLDTIDIDAILDSSMLEQLIEDNHISPFSSNRKYGKARYCSCILI